MTKLAQLHDLTNQAFLRQLEQTHQSIGDYCLRSGMNVSVLFAQRAVFVAGQLLKGSRTTYDSANELGATLEWCGGSEPDTRPRTLMAEIRGSQTKITTTGNGFERGATATGGRGARIAALPVRRRVSGPNQSGTGPDRRGPTA